MVITTKNNAIAFEWIDCKEELPPDYELVMVWNTKFDGPRWGVRKGNHFRINCSRVKMSDQSHWARVPRPAPGVNVRGSLEPKNGG